LKKWIWVENLIQLFESKMDVQAHPSLNY